MNKSRGVLLTILVILAALNILLSLYGYTQPDIIKEAYGRLLPSWYLIFLTATRLVELAVLAGIWMWKRTAVYLFVVLILVSWSVQISVYGLHWPLTQGVWGLVAAPIGIGLWAWAIYRKWRLFK